MFSGFYPPPPCPGFVAMMVLSATWQWAHTNMRRGLPCRSRVVSGLVNLNILNSGSTLEPTTGFQPANSCLQGRCLERLATSAQRNYFTTGAQRMQGKNYHPAGWIRGNRCLSFAKTRRRPPLPTSLPAALKSPPADSGPLPVCLPFGHQGVP